MKIVDERQGEQKRFVKRITVYPFLQQEDEIRFDGNISAQMEMMGNKEPYIYFNIQLSEMSGEKLGQFIQALEQVKRFLDPELFANPDKPLPIVTTIYLKPEEQSPWGIVTMNVSVNGNDWHLADLDEPYASEERDE